MIACEDGSASDSRLKLIVDSRWQRRISIVCMLRETDKKGTDIACEVASMPSAGQGKRQGDGERSTGSEKGIAGVGAWGWWGWWGREEE
jgi:hypothetical protein